MSNRINTTGTSGDNIFFRGENPLHADKLNAAFAERLWTKGDTMLGSLMLWRDPRVPLEAATKQYVDAQLTHAISGAGGAVSIRDTPPLGPFSGDMWWDSVGGNLYICYDDGNSQQWVIANTVAALGGVPEVSSVPAGQTWGRQYGAWVGVLPLSGGTLTGNLTSAAPAIISVGDQSTPGWNRYGVPVLQVGARGAQNAIVGLAQTTSLNNYPTGLTGVGTNSAPGGSAFGLYSEGHTTTTGTACGAEIDSFNDTGTAPDASLPPNRGMGTSFVVPIALTLAAGGTAPSSVALQICREGGQPQHFLTGIYIGSDAVDDYALFIDADAANGAATSAVIKAKQDAIALQIQATGTDNPAFALMTVVNANGAYVAAILQDGTYTTPTGHLIAQYGTLSGPLAITDATGAYIKLTGNGPTPTKYLRAYGGKFDIINDAYNSQLLSLDDTGNLAVIGTVTTPQVNLNSTAGPTIRAGVGLPSGIHPGASIWLRTDGSAGQHIYVSAGEGTWVPIVGV